jgi:hypothetical protein
MSARAQEYVCPYLHMTYPGAYNAYSSCKSGDFQSDSDYYTWPDQMDGTVETDYTLSTSTNYTRLICHQTLRTDAWCDFGTQTSEIDMNLTGHGYLYSEGLEHSGNCYPPLTNQFVQFAHSHRHWFQIDVPHQFQLSLTLDTGGECHLLAPDGATILEVTGPGANWAVTSGELPPSTGDYRLECDVQRLLASDVSIPQPCSWLLVETPGPLNGYSVNLKLSPIDPGSDALTMRFTTKTSISWVNLGQETAWNIYRGDLNQLRLTGIYTQNPQIVPNAARFCSLSTPLVTDDFVPALGEVVYYLATRRVNGLETLLGTNSAGQDRANLNPCQ